MCKVSVIIPVYDVEAWLPECLNSVLGQTFSELEVLAVDDASPDGCGQILDDYAKQDKRLCVFHLKENRRQGYGRNLGLSSAKGRYVYFLDADDCIRPETLQALYEAAEAEALDGVFFDSEPVFTSDDMARRYADYPAAFTGICPDGVCSGRELFHAMSTQNQWTCYIQRQFWRREFLLKHALGFPEGTEHEDESFSFRAVLLAERMRYLHRAYFLRRYRPNSVMTRRAEPRDFHGYFRIYNALVDFTWDHGLENEPGVQIQLGRLWDRCVRFYPVFAAQELPERWFETDAEMLRRYRAFAASRWQSSYDRSTVEELFSQLDRDEGLWIYGAGILGRRCFRGLSDAGFRIEGFLVTERRGNPDTLFGRPVCTLNETDAPGFAIVSLSRGYREEIHRMLAAAAWRFLDMP